MATKKPVTIRLSERQIEIIEDAARRVGMQRTEFIRTAALSHAFLVTSQETSQPLLPGFYIPALDGPSTSQESTPTRSTAHNGRRRSRRPTVAGGRESP